MRQPLALVAMLLLSSASSQTTHELRISEEAFVPAFLSIQLGDRVHILWDENTTMQHSFTQVERATWAVGGTLPLNGGLDLGGGTSNPGRDFIITPTSTVWYVCRHNAGLGMKGLISVEGGAGLDESAGPHEVRFAPNPASARTTVVVPDDFPVEVRILDREGTPLLRQQLHMERVLDVSALAPGVYLAEVWHLDGPLLGRKRLLVER